MPRIARSELPPNGIYHVTARGTGGEPIFRSDLDRVDFLDLAFAAGRRMSWTFHVWCLMTTHYHLVLETSVPRLSSGMHRLHTAYAQRFNRRYDRRGHLFEGRFSSWVIRGDAHLEATYRYVLENPARAALTSNDDPWPWSGESLNLHPAAAGPRRP